MMKNKSPLVYFFITLAAIAVFAFFGPEEKSLGSNDRIVYLHGGWVITVELMFFLASLFGLLALSLRKNIFHVWSSALGKTGVFFWLTYLPLSLWATQSK